MEPDFAIRNELDSISHRDDSLDAILSQYSESPTTTSTGSPSVLNGLLSNLQSSLGFLHRDNQYIKSKLGDSEESGVKLVIGPDTLKWIVLLLVILIGLILFFQTYKGKKKKNPLKKRLLALESEIKTLKRQNPFHE